MTNKLLTDVRIDSVKLYLLPVTTRSPLKFGHESLNSITCARVLVCVVDRSGRRAQGWGETPLSVQWAWPSPISYQSRHDTLIEFMLCLAEAWSDFDSWGHPIEVGYAFQRDNLQQLVRDFNRGRPPESHIPYLAALVCCSPIDIALHDAYGVLLGLPVYQTYNSQFMSADLADYLIPIENSDVSFGNSFPSDFLRKQPKQTLLVWHLVGALDPLDESELTGSEPADGYPVHLKDWINRDGLECLKIKLRGNDAKWDLERIVRVGQIALQNQVRWLSTDFNCTVDKPEYVTEILDQLAQDEPATFDRLLYIEQPFAYELSDHAIDVRSISNRKPLFLDESAHDWTQVKLGRELGWNGVALKTCKTQTGAILSLCWAQAHGMDLMVQDLTNPMLAQVPHVLLAAHCDTIMGVESNAMQFYPDVSLPESRVHPGLYARRGGAIDLSTIDGPGFGYRVNEIGRRLPQPTAVFSSSTDFCRLT